MTDNPKTALVTVGLPVYNGERWVGAAIEGILAQSFRDFVLLISDNCSTDGTFEICSRYAAQDPRIWLVRSPRNVGAAENFNTVCRMAVGKYFKYASCNDLCAPDFLLRCVEVLERHDDVVVCCPKTVLIDDETGATEEYPHGLHLTDERPVRRFREYLENVRLNNVEQGLIRLDAIRRTVLQGSFMGSDLIFMAELALYGKFYELPEPLFFRRGGRQSMSARRSKEEIATLYEPGARVLLWQTWKVMLAYSGMAFRVKLELGAKLKLLAYIARKWRYAAADLRADVVQAMRYGRGQLRRFWAGDVL